MSERLFRIDHDDGLSIEATWDAGPVWLADRVNGELTLTVTAGDDVLARERHTLHVAQAALEPEARKLARKLESKVRASE